MSALPFRKARAIRHRKSNLLFSTTMSDDSPLDVSATGLPVFTGSLPAVSHTYQSSTSASAANVASGGDNVPTTETPAAATDQPTDATTTAATGHTITNHPSFIRHCPSSTNRHAYIQKTGKQLAPLLIDEKGMGTRFQLLSNDLFSARIPGDAPSDEDRAKFESPNLETGMLEKKIYPELVSGDARMSHEFIADGGLDAG